MPAKKSVIVIGGGIIGLCSAYYSMRKGHKVTVLERGGPDHDCCSLGNAGMIVPSHFVPLAAPGMVGMGLRMLRDPEGPFAIRPRFDKELMLWCWRFTRSANARHVSRSAPLLRDLHLLGRISYEELSHQLDLSFGLVKRGLLMICKTEEALAEEAGLAIDARKLGLEAEVLDPPEVAKLEPSITVDAAGAVYYPQDCYLDPRKLMAGLYESLSAGGVEFIWNAEVTGWRTGSRRVEAVLTGKWKHSADEFVVAAGSWSSSVLRDLKISLPMQAGKGYSFEVPHPPQMPEICSILKEARVAVTPMGSALRFAGTMEIMGTDLSVNAARVHGIRKAIPQYFPKFRSGDFVGLPVWSGLRPCSPDGLPYVGRFKRYSNLIAATGHAMMGISLAPATGRLVSEMISGEIVSIDCARLNPDRFGG